MDHFTLVPLLLWSSEKSPVGDDIRTNSRPGDTVYNHLQIPSNIFYGVFVERAITMVMVTLDRNVMIFFVEVKKQELKQTRIVPCDYINDTYGTHFVSY